MTSQVSFTFRDYADEPSNVSLHIEEVDAAGFDGAVSGKSDLLTAIQGVTLGEYYKSFMSVDIDKGLPTPSSNPLAQREIKWLVRCYDTVNSDLVTFELPCADLSLLETTNEDKLDISAGAGAALVTAIEANVLSKAGNAVSVIEVLVVGRSL
jgi:hypothetical protein